MRLYVKLAVMLLLACAAQRALNLPEVMHDFWFTVRCQRAGADDVELDRLADEYRLAHFEEHPPVEADAPEDLYVLASKP